MSIRYVTVNGQIHELSSESLRGLGEWGWDVSQDLERLNAFSTTAAAAPVSGTYVQGDIVWNTAPTAGGNIGWVCTVAGTPGTWVAFGQIEPYSGGGSETMLSTLNGNPTYLGEIIAGTGAAVNNHTTAVPFNNTGAALTNKVVLLQGDVAFRVLSEEDNTPSVSSTNGVVVGSNDRIAIAMDSTHGWVSVIAVTGTATVKVWELVYVEAA